MRVMAMAYVRYHYGVPAKLGMRVRITDPNSGRVLADGPISSSRGQYIGVEGNYWHPTWGAEYFDASGKIIWPKDEGE